ncbi:MAG: exonuclease SbcCD subunit D [Oscillospiraceae bacterium]|nr:exonuclease SbcCD subunit D [Oscillospiraceae bacterium]
MKFLHISDLHLGKRLNGVSLLEDQRYILKQILELTDQADAVLIAGDVYDKAVPPAEAVTLFDGFLTELTRRGKPVLLISGNHDSAQRLAFGGTMLSQSGVHVSPVFDGKLEPVLLEDDYGTVAVYLLPFLKAAHVRPFFEEEELNSCEEAIACVLQHTKLDETCRNVLVAHQFVAGARQCESEEVSVGGLDQVSTELFKDFDYVALGHLHTPQTLGRDTIRYSGSPLKYSVSEMAQQKAALLVTMEEKENVAIKALPLNPLRDLVHLKGRYDELTDRKNYQNRNLEDYYHITLTDEEDIPQAMARLQTIYPNLLSLDYHNRRTRGQLDTTLQRNQEDTDPMSLLEQFYEKRNGQSMTDSQIALARKLMEEIWEGEA